MRTLRSDDARTRTWVEADSIDLVRGISEDGVPFHRPLAATDQQKRDAELVGMRCELRGCEHRVFELEQLRADEGELEAR